jgi:hypothetical protein
VSIVNGSPDSYATEPLWTLEFAYDPDAVVVTADGARLSIAGGGTGNESTLELYIDESGGVQSTTWR